jgi:hypothetical protein
MKPMIYGPHHTVFALDVLAIVLIPVVLWAVWRLVRQYRKAYAAMESVPAPALPALSDEGIPEAQLVRTPIATARKEICS